MNRFYIAGLSLCFAATAYANPTEASRRGGAANDSIAILGKRYAQELKNLVNEVNQEVKPSKVLENPYYFPLLTTSAYYDFATQSTLGTLDARETSLTTQVSEALLDVYAHHPELITYDFSNIASEAKAEPKAVAANTAELVAPALVTSQAASKVMQEPEELPLEVRKPNFWTYKGNFSLQFMQYYVSDNWYKGGENHNSFLAAANLEANYDNKERLSFTNKLEMRLGFQSSNTDTEHKYKTNTDLIRLTNKLGLKATNNWSYTVMLQSWTQFYRGFQANKPQAFSDFMSPFESVFSIGMDYKLSKKNFELVATLAPLAINFKYVDRLHLSTRYGLEEGKHSRFDFGSSMTIGTKWRIMKDVEWVSRFFAFTNYSRVQAEWENTFNFKVNKFLSAKLFLYPRFDDGVRRKDGESYFQFNEFLSIGFDYNF